MSEPWQFGARSVIAAGVEVQRSVYCPKYAEPDARAMRRWRWFGRWLGRPRPKPEEVFFLVEPPSGGNRYAVMHPDIYAKLVAELAERRRPS